MRTNYIKPGTTHLYFKINVYRFFFFFGRMNYSFNTVVSSSTFNNFRQNPKKSLAAFLGLKVHYIFIHRYTVYTQDTVYTQTLPYCLIDRYLPLIDVEGRLKKNTLYHYSKGFTNNKFTCMRKKNTDVSAVIGRGPSTPADTLKSHQGQRHYTLHATAVTHSLCS